MQADKGENENVPEDPIAVRRSVHSSNTRCGIRPSGVRNIHTDALVGIATRLCLTDNDLLDLAILPKIFRSTKCLEELVLVAYCGVEADHIHQVLLHDPDTSQILPTGGLYFAFFNLFLLCGRSLAMFQCQVRLEPVRESECVSGDPQFRIAKESYVLVCIRDLILYGAIIVRASAVGAPAFFAVGFDIVVTELANLGISKRVRSEQHANAKRKGFRVVFRTESARNVPDTHRDKV